MNDIQQFRSEFDESAEREIAALQAYRKVYEARNPPPIMKEVERDDRLIMLALVAMVVSGVIVSGSRTVIEFGGGVIGAAAFVMIELSIVAYAYISARGNYTEEKHQNIHKLLRFGLFFALFVAIAANIHATIKAETDMPEIFNTMILVTIGICAPVLAFISGEAWAMVSVGHNSRRKRAQNEYEQRLTEWKIIFNQSWSSQKSRILQGGRSISVRSEQAAEQQRMLPVVKEKTSGELVSGYLEDDNEHRKQTVREIQNGIEALYGRKVSTSTIHTIMKKYQFVEASGDE